MSAGWQLIPFYGAQNDAGGAMQRILVISPSAW
jgi:hypothetical protein